LLAIERYFATALTRLLNAFQVGGIGSLPTEAILATMLLASQARSVSEVNRLLMLDLFHPFTDAKTDLPL
jgi:hypothetical protein